MTELSPTTPPLKLCITALHAYGAIDNQASQGVGGTETRAWLLARGLAQKQSRLDVEFVVRTSQLQQSKLIEKARVTPYVDPLFELWQEAGHLLKKQPTFPFIIPRKWTTRLITIVPQLLLSWHKRKAYGGGFRVDDQLPEADVYLTFGVQGHSARVIETAKQRGKPSVLFLGSDGDLEESYVLGNPEINPYGDPAELCRQILDQADVILCQTSHQQQILEQRFEREATLIANPIDLNLWSPTAEVPTTAETDQLFRKLPAKPFVLWVGRADPVHKRPMKCVEIAQQSPEIPFVMIMNPRDPAEQLRVEQALPPNVTLIEKVSPELMPAVFQRSLCLLNTSALEGFANTFLQAAAMGKPIVSLCVDSPLLSEGKAGLCLNSEKPEVVQQTLSSLVEMKTLSPHIDRTVTTQYVLQNHSLDAIITQLAQALSIAVETK